MCCMKDRRLLRERHASNIRMAGKCPRLMEPAEHAMKTLPSSDVVSAHITVRDGTRIGYSLHGAAEHTTRVVLLHSLAMNRDFWQPVIEQLTPRASVLAIDCRGHGVSGKPAGPYTVEQFAQDVHDVVTALDFGGVLIAGASMGGCGWLQFGAPDPQRTPPAGLVDPTPWSGETAPNNRK